MQHLDSRFLVAFRSRPERREPRSVQGRIRIVKNSARTTGLALAAMCSGFLALGGAPAAWAQGKAVGPIMCACPGKHRELGPAASCEEACFGKKPGASGGAPYDPEAVRRAEEAQIAAERYGKITVELERVMSEATKHPSPQARYEAYIYARDLYREQQAIQDSAPLREALSRVEAQITWHSGLLDARNKNYLAAREKLMAAYNARRDLFNEEDFKYIVEVNSLHTRSLPNLSRIYQAPPTAGEAWRQLTCTASIMRRAIAGVMESADYRSLRQMSDEARKAMDGGEPSLPCQPAPPLPMAFALPEEREKLKTVQAQIIDKAQLLGARMEQREAGLSEQARKAMKKVQAATPATGMKPETEVERLRRVQLALNRINEVKLDGKSVEAIQAQEKDRVDMGKLLLATEKIEKGNIDLGIDLSGGTSRGQRGSPSP